MDFSKHRIHRSKVFVTSFQLIEYLFLIRLIERGVLPHTPVHFFCMPKRNEPNLPAVRQGKGHRKCKILPRLPLKHTINTCHS